MAKSYDFLTVSKFYIRSLGWPIYPLRGMSPDKVCSCGKCDKPGKHPATPKGKSDATLDVDLLELFVHNHDCRGWSTPTGLQSGIIVVDIDGPDGENSVQELANQYCTLPPTVEVRSGSGGRHLYYRCVPGVKTTSSRLAPAIDIRADNGSIILPPTLHKSGQRYEWIKAPWEITMAPLPLWIPQRLAYVQGLRDEERRNRHREKLTARRSEPDLRDDLDAYDPVTGDLLIGDAEPAATPAPRPAAGTTASPESATSSRNRPDANPTSTSTSASAAATAAPSPQKATISQRAVAASGRPMPPRNTRDTRSSEERLRAWRADPERARDRINEFAGEVAGLGEKSRSRNETLNRNAYIAFRIARDANVPDRVVIQAFLEAGRACGLAVPEIKSTLRSAQLGAAAP
jgi:Bifunctional DNA primase/polymerase, N-terminal